MAMNMIYMFSPYLLNESPKTLAFTLGQRDEPPLLEDLDYAGLSVLVDGAVKYTTGLLALDSLRKHEGYLNVHRRRKTSIRLKLEVVKRIRGSNFVAYRYLPLALPAPSKTGVTRVIVSGRIGLVSSMAKKMSARLSKAYHKPRPVYTTFAQSKPVRPSPEIVNRQFLKVTEVGTLGVLQPLQSARSVVPVLSYRRDWTGTRTPGFRTLKKRQLPVNPHTVSIKEVLEDRYSQYQVNTWTGDHSLDVRPFSDVYTAPGDFDRQAQLDSADFKAIQRLVSKANAGIQANLAQTLAQGNLVAKMVLQNASQIIQSVRQLKRGNIPGAISALNSGRSSHGRSGRANSAFPKVFPPINPNGLSSTQSLASNWLALQYGWKPLLADIEGLMKLLPNLTSPTGFVQQVRSSASVSNDRNERYPLGDALIGTANTGLTTWKNRTSVKYVIGIRVDDAAQSFFAQTGLTDPISLAWELLPFSFVADWILPIGGYLEMRNAFQGFTLMGGSKTTCVRTIVASDMNFGGTVNGVPQTLLNRMAVYRKEMVTITRSPVVTWPSPSLPSFTLNPFQKSNLPGLVDGTNDRALNAIALLTQFFKK